MRSSPGPRLRSLRRYCTALALAAPVLAGCGSTAVGTARSGRTPAIPRLSVLVDPFIGTGGQGNVFPGAVAPFGMVQWSPDSSAGGLLKPGGYNDGDLIVSGFSLTHLSGAGCVAFGNVPFVPTNRPLLAARAPNGSPYSDRIVPGSEHASPGRYAVRLASGIGVRLAATTRTGIAAFSYPAGHPASLLIGAGDSAGAGSNTDGALGAEARLAGPQLMTGWAEGGHFCGLGNRYRLYFAARFDQTIGNTAGWWAGVVHPGAGEAHGPHSGLMLSFKPRGGQPLRVKVGISYTGVAGALRNLSMEDPGWDVAAVAHSTARAWDRMLGRALIRGGSPARRTTFYTALYHSLLAPSVFSDVDGRYVGFDGAVHDDPRHTHYANFSGWDIYRSEVPLLALLCPGRTSDMMQSLVDAARQGGALPRWPVANAYTEEMDGDSADPILAGAYAFGARHFDLGEALAAMQRGATHAGTNRAGYVERPDLAAYLARGYGPVQTNGWGAAAQTLEYETDDWSIAQLAQAMHQPAIARSALRRALGWPLQWNRETGWIEPRDGTGSFPADFTPTGTAGFVEGNAAQYTWMVPFDLPGLARRMGGDRQAVARLDALFGGLNAGPTVPHYWAGNEVGLEIPWEYDAYGAPWRTQAVVRSIADQLYAATPTGLPGNDDLGALSSWYVWAALGLYPEIPGVAGLAVGAPLFPDAVLTSSVGRSIELTAPGAGESRPYIRSLMVNGRPYDSPWITLSALPSHAHLRFTLAGVPNRSWGRTGWPSTPAGN